MSDIFEKPISRIIKYAYVRDSENPDRVLTIARKWGRKGNKIHYGFALCRPDADQFRKDIGRTIACGRLLNKPLKVRPEGEGLVLRSVMRDIATAETTPRIVRKIAQDWLVNESVPLRSDVGQEVSDLSDIT